MGMLRDLHVRLSFSQCSVHYTEFVFFYLEFTVACTALTAFLANWRMVARLQGKKSCVIT